MKYFLFALLLTGCTTITQTDSVIDLRLMHSETVLLSDNPVIQEFVFDVIEPPFEDARIRFTNDQIYPHYKGYFQKGKKFTASVEIIDGEFVLISLRAIR